MSGLSGVGDAVSCTFTIGKRKKRQSESEMPNNMPMPLPADPIIHRAVDHCLELARTEEIFYLGTFPPESPQTLAEKLVPCPCFKYQADYDRARFIKLENDTRDCYISAQPISILLPAFQLIALTQMCCYDN